MLLSARAPRRPRSAGPCSSRTSARATRSASTAPASLQRAHQRGRHALLRRRGPQARHRAVAKRRHPQGHADGQGHQPGPAHRRPRRFSSDPFALTAVGRTLYFVAEDGIHGRGAVAKQRHGARNADGQGHHWLRRRQYLGSPTDVAGTLFYVVGDQPIASCGEATAPRRGRRWSSEFDCIFGTSRPSGGTLYFAANAASRYRPVAKRRHGVRDGAGQGNWATTSFTSPTSAAPSSSPPTTAPTPGCGEATAPRRERPWSSSWESHPNDLTVVGGTLYFTIGRLRRQWPALAKRRHRGGDDPDHLRRPHP